MQRPKMTTMITPHDRILPGIAMMLGFCAIAPLIDVAAKMAAQSVTITQVTLFRMLVQALLMLPVVWVLGQSLRLSRAMTKLMALRALMLLGSTYTFVGAVAVMPIADALAIVFVEPFILLVLGALIFGEQVGPRRIIASVIGFLGALLVIQPNFAAFGAVALLPLGTAMFFALYMLLTRRITREVAPEVMQAQTALFGTVMMLPVLGIGHVMGWGALMVGPAQPVVWVQLFCVGLAATVSHMMITYALRFAPSATLAPLHYLEIISAVAVGWLFFQDWPNLMSWAGIAVITGSGLYIIARERALARMARR
jgi:drug/metabolite transporter (DMT)-like permease